jgi:hypothetical protein
MNKLTTLLPATLLALACQLAAAEPESSFGLAPSSSPQLAPGTPQPAAAPAPAAAAAAPASSIPLIPDSLQPTEKPKPPKMQGDRTALSEDKLKHKIEIRLAKNKAEREPDLIALKAQAYAAPTDFEQRALFTRYYKSLAERMGKMDRAILQPEIEELKARYSAEYYQFRISPTVDPETFRNKHN